MPITLRASQNYNSPLAVLPLNGLVRAPVEGPKGAFVELLWSQYSSQSCHLSFSQFATDTFSQVSALSVDNSQCGADVQFIFTDTNETVTIPAYSPKTIIEVITNNREMYIQTVGLTLSNDITRFTVLNFVPPPTSVSVSQEQNTVANAAIAADGATTTQLVAHTVNGTLETVYIYRGSPAAGLAGPGSQTWTLKDGSGTVFFSGTFAGGNLSSWNVPLMQLGGLNLRFAQGLQLTQTGSALGGTYSVALAYRTP